MMGNECGVQKEKAFDLSLPPASFIFNIRVNSGVSEKNWVRNVFFTLAKKGLN